MRTLLTAIIAITLCFSCTKQEPVITDPAFIPDTDISSYINADSNSNIKNTITNKAILVDASRDGGVWWFPQAGNFSANEWRQGKALADYLMKMGYYVEEVPRGALITWPYLSRFHNVIRFVGCGTYTKEEIDAYDSLASHSASILLINDHLANGPNDPLSSHWGLNFSGAVKGAITEFDRHPITNGVYSLEYNAGSVITNPDLKKISVLGYFSAVGTQQVALGILHHPDAKIVFIGDGNGIEEVPQPFTDNLVKWLFQ